MTESTFKSPHDKESTLRIKPFICVAAAVLSISHASVFAQQNRRSLPSVSELIKLLDKNSDGKLTRDEVTQQPYARNFSRWDSDEDGAVTEKEISAFRRKLGIPVDGSGREPNRTASEFTIPDAKDLIRVDRKTRPSRQAMQHSAYIINTQAHEVSGDSYVILTDHNQPSFLNALKRLAKHRGGSMLRVNDLATLHKSADEMSKVRNQLRKAKVRYLAIAPRMESFRENMLLGMFELISTLDEDPQLDTFPGLLLASNEKNFEALIGRSIAYTAIAKKELRPFAISQVPSVRETRSLQKSGILRKLFADYRLDVPTVAIYGASAKNAPKLPGDQFWSIHRKSRRDVVRTFPDPAAAEFNKASLLIMHGHGVPGMSCGVDISAIPESFSAKVVMCGSCFSTSPAKSDLPAMRQAPGGYGVEARDAFTIRAIDNGASIAFGHMRLSQGFPHLFPVLENWMSGLTVGEAYQRLVNGLIEMGRVKSGDFVISDPPKNGRQPPQNALLYVVIGDPAIQPLQRIAP